MDSDRLVKAVCSFFVPGLGQFMNGNIERGLIFLIGFIILWFALLFLGIVILHTIVGFLGIVILHTIVGIIVRLFAAYDAYTYDGF